MAAELNSDTNSPSSSYGSKVLYLNTKDGLEMNEIEIKKEEIASVKIQKNYLTWHDRRTFIMKKNAAKKLQKWYRQHLIEVKVANERRKRIESELDAIELAEKYKAGLSLVEIPEEPSNCYTETNKSELNESKINCEDQSNVRMLEALYNEDCEVQTALTTDNLFMLEKYYKISYLVIT